MERNLGSKWIRFRPNPDTVPDVPGRAPSPGLIHTPAFDSASMAPNNKAGPRESASKPYRWVRPAAGRRWRIGVARPFLKGWFFMQFRSVFVAIVIAFALIVAAFLISHARPRVEIQQSTAAFVRASGKCTECHARLQYAVVHEYEMSAHAKKGVSCLDCHQPAPGQKKVDHHGFVISDHLTAGNCRACHEGIYQEFLRSRQSGAGCAARWRRPWWPQSPP